MTTRARALHGFTIIELLVVLAVIGMLLAIAAPRYVQHLDNAREVVLKQDLQQMRDAIDKFYADQARYPATLDELVTKHYLRSIPVDPITDRADTWKLQNQQGQTIAGQPASVAFDVHSGASGQGLDGTAYATW